MRRREVLKGLTIAAGGALGPNWAWPMLVPQQNAQATQPLAVPIRGLVKKDGRLLQPVQITVQHSGVGIAAVTSLNGAEVDRRTLSAGSNTFQVFTNPVGTPQDVSVTVAVGDRVVSAGVKLDPVRKILVYVLPHSHHDLGYTDLQANIEEKQMNNITQGIELARKTANYPEGARFVWNLEVLWGADLFMRRKSQAEKDEFIDAVKKGWVSLNGMYANELTGLCRPEELLQLFRYGVWLGRECGVKVDAAMISDVPGYTWGTVTAMAQAGIRYFSVAPNWFDRIGRIMVEWQDRPFWAISPSGKEKVLVWIPWSGYAFSHVERTMNVELVAKYQDRLDAVKYPYDISYNRWSGHGDNAVPDGQICEFIKTWSEEYEWPKFVISSTSGAFSAFEKRYGSELPRFKGDLTPYWEDGAGSSALETGINRNAADRLTQTEALTAMLVAGAHQDRPNAEAFNDAWRNVLLYSEHTWGAGGSVSAPEAPMTTKQWDVKRQFAVEAEKQSKHLLGEVLPTYATGNDASAIDVHNTTSWSRTEVVILSAEMSATGDRVKDQHGKVAASQRLSTGELAFLARDVPAFGVKRFHLSKGKAQRPTMAVSVKDGLLENGVIRVKVDTTTGDLIELTLNGETANLVDTSGGEAVNEFLFLEGGDVAKMQKSGPAKVCVEEAGPLIASLRIESPAPGCNSLMRRVCLMVGADWIKLSNVVDKKRAAIDPHPEDPATAREFSQHGGKESLQFAFPFAISGGEMHIDIPLAEMRPEVDQLPGSCKNWLPVGRWIDVANTKQGVTWVTLDAPLVEVGGITATMLGSQRDPSIWREHIAPTQKFYSWAMNNHWGTNYRAYQEGVVEFRYALRAHRGYDPASASRLAIGLSQPLVASAARSNVPFAPVLAIEPPDVLALALKLSEDGRAWIVRLFGASGEDRKARLRWSQPTPPRIWMSDLSERPIEALDGEIAVAGWDLMTVRVDRL
ncbi:MAG TPA: glycosyl hydrolase-related protein [Terracidiphilus sp.]|nr:glycosyl hydrolase-related protein [Terracidiphilus sp.]